MKKAALFVLLAFSVSGSLLAQRVFWSEGNNGRIRVGNLGTTSITGSADFITGLTNPRRVEVDQINNILYYNNFSVEDIRSSNLTTAAFISNVITTGAMAGFYDFAYSDNAGGLFAPATDEVQGVYFIPWNNNDSNNDFKLNLGALSDDVFYSAAVDDGNEFVYLANSFDGGIYRTGFSGGTMLQVASLSNPIDIAYDWVNNDLYIINDGAEYQLYRLDLDGGALSLLFNLGTTPVQAVQPYPQFGKIYFSRSNTGIFAVNIDGTGSPVQQIALAGTGDIYFDIQEDLTSPVFTALSPVNNATGVSTAPTLTMTFDENVKISTTSAVGNDLNIRILRLSDNFVHQTIDRSSGNISIVNNVLTISGITGLDANTQYYVLIGNKVVSDLSGNNFIGITTNAGWRFETVPGVIITAASGNACVSSYTDLPDIVITEANNTNFKAGTNVTLVLSLSSGGYLFEAGTGTVSHTAGRNISVSAINVTSASVTVTYTVTAETLSDIMTISGLRVQSGSPANPPANIIRSGGTATVDGLAVNTILGTLTTQISPAAPSITYPNGALFCLNADVTGTIVSVTGTAPKWYNDAALTTEIASLNGSLSATGPDLAVSTASAQTFNRYVTQTSGGCESTATTVSIVVDPGPQAISTGFTPQTACSGPPNGAAVITDVNGEGLTNYTIDWYDGSLNALGLSGATLSGISAGDYNGRVTSNITGCSTFATTISVPDQLEPPVLLMAVEPLTNCETPNGSVTATVENPKGALSEYSFTWYEGPDTGSPVIPISTSGITGMGAGSYGVISRHNPTGCESAFTAAMIPDATVAPVAGTPSGEVCETVYEAGSANVDLTSYNGTITGGNADLTVTWLDNSSNPITTAVVSTGNAINFVVKSSSSGCETAASLAFTVSGQPTPADAGPDQTFCGTTTTLEANTPTSGTGTWTIVGNPPGASLSSPSAPNSSFTGIPGNGYTLEWTTTSVPQCASSVSSVSITLTAPPTTANAGATQTVCDAPVTLGGNAPVSGTGMWTIVSGTGGVIANPSQPNSSFTGTAGNSYLLRWTISNGDCTPSESDVQISITAPPTIAAAGPDQETCDTQVSLAANAPDTGTGSWSVVSGSGGTIADPSDPASAFSGTTGTTYILRWTTANGVCTASTDEVTIQFNEIPSVSLAGSDQEICGNSTTLAGNVPVSGIGTWSIATGTGGSFSDAAFATSTFTGIAGNVYTLRWTISSGGSCPVSEDDVVITFVAPPTQASAGADQTICGTSFDLAANAPVTGVGQWSVVTGQGGTFGNAALANSSFTGTVNTTYTLRWTTSNGICPSSTDDVMISLVNPPTVAEAGADQAICGSGLTLAANAPSSGTGIWSIVTGAGGLISAPSSPTSAFSGVPGTTYTLRWTIAQSGCPSSTDDVIVQLKRTPQGTGVLSALPPLCQGAEATISLTGVSNATTYEWVFPQGVVTQSQNGSAITILAESGTGGALRVTPSNECGSGPTTNGNIVLLQLPDVTINVPASPYPLDPVNFTFSSNASILQSTWEFGDGASAPGPSSDHAYESPGDYVISLFVTGSNGCQNQVTAPFTVSGEPELGDAAIKNVITANGDEKNRYLHIVNLERHPENEVRFLDRWGVEVFSAANYQNNWDARGRNGDYLPAGQYICIVKLNTTGKVFSRTVSIIKGR